MLLNNLSVDTKDLEKTLYLSWLDFLSLLQLFLHFKNYLRRFPYHFNFLSLLIFIFNFLLFYGSWNVIYFHLIRQNFLWKLILFCSGDAGEKLISHSLAHWQSWEESIEAWQQPILDDAQLPDWFKVSITWLFDRFAKHD